MSVEFLKALFSDKALTFDEFAKAVAESKDIKLANLADGKYVDKQKLDDKAGELKPWRRRKANPNGTKQAFCRRQMGAAATFCRLPDGAGEGKESRGIIRAGDKGVRKNFYANYTK